MYDKLFQDLEKKTLQAAKNKQVKCQTLAKDGQKLRQMILKEAVSSIFDKDLMFKLSCPSNNERYKRQRKLLTLYYFIVTCYNNHLLSYYIYYIYLFIFLQLYKSFIDNKYNHLYFIVCIFIAILTG